MSNIRYSKIKREVLDTLEKNGECHIESIVESWFERGLPAEEREEAVGEILEMLFTLGRQDMCVVEGRGFRNHVAKWYTSDPEWEARYRAECAKVAGVEQWVAENPGDVETL